MPLTGTHVRTLDEKNRLAIPKPFREALAPEEEGSVLVVAPETEHSLALFSTREFQRRADEIRARGGTTEVRTYLRLYFSQAENVEVDKQGRIRIPDRLMEFAGLRQEVTLLGVNDRVELWDKSRWDEFLAAHNQSFDEMARGF